MADFPSSSALFQAARNEVLLKNGQLSVEAVDRDGSDANVLLAAAARIGDEVIGQLVNVVSGLYLDSATGDNLNRLIIDRYGITRKEASTGLVTLTFTANIAPAANVVIPANTLVRSTTGVNYQTVYPETLLAGDTVVQSLARSSLGGVNQQVNAFTLTTLSSPIPDAVANGITLSVTNALASSGAADRETDSDYRTRGQAFFTSSRRGTLSAIEQGALTTPGVVRARAFETLGPSGNPNGYVSLVIADQYTDTLATLTMTNPTYAAQSQALAQSVFNTLQEYRPAGIFVNVQTAQVILQPIVLSLSFVAGVNADTVALAVRSAVVTYINNLNPGDDLTFEGLNAVIVSISGIVDNGSPIYSPPLNAGDSIVTTPLQVLRTSLSIVRANASTAGSPLGG